MEANGQREGDPSGPIDRVGPAEGGWHLGGGATELAAHGLVRDRLLTRLLNADDYSVARVVAPAGSGKSRLLSHVARRYAGPVAWCGPADPVLRSEDEFIAWVAKVLRHVPGSSIPDPDGSRLTVNALVRGAYPESSPPVLVILDDVHLLEDSDAEAALSDLASRAPRWMRLLIAGRVSLALDLSRLRVSGDLVEIDHDDLRFRTWEIEELFRDVYLDPLLPEDVGVLARRTGGWAAYLQLFHLATARKPPSVRRQVLSTLSGQSRLVREYLSRHVLSDLTPGLKDFLVRTSVLRRPTPELCDELLGEEATSREHLGELERRQLFTERGEDGSYRYHPVLLSYLDSVLVETLGIKTARESHRQAAAMLERAGFAEEALAAFARSEDWVGVARVLGHASGPASVVGDAWLEALPPTVIEADPMLLLARARRALSSGAVDEAVRITRQAESASVSSAVAERCSKERERLLAWAEPAKVDPADAADWSMLLRAATQKDPESARRRAASMSGPQGRFVEGLASLAYGDVAAAARVLIGVAAHPESPAWMTAAARIATVIAERVAGGTPDPINVERAREEAEAAGVPWLLRIAGLTLMSAAREYDEVCAELLAACRREGDHWGEALLSLGGGVVGLAAGEPTVAPLDHAVQMFSRLGAGVFAATAAGYQSVAAYRCGDLEGALRCATQARSLGVALGVPVACALGELTRGLVDHDADAVDAAKRRLVPLGSWNWHAALTGMTSSDARSEAAAELERSIRAHVDFRPTVEDVQPPVFLRCLGRFSLTIGGREVDESAAKPMERMLLHLLAARAGAQVHREEIIEALWPEADPDAGRHRLQVAMSSLRRILADQTAVAQLLLRDGDTYRLALPPDSDADVWRVEHHLRRAAAARASCDEGTETMALDAALSAYGGPLLPMDGPAEWVVGQRARLEVALADAATRLAVLRRDAGDHKGSSDAARRGLSVDRFRDELWNLLIDEAELSGHPAEAGRARQSYAEVLEELGA